MIRSLLVTLGLLGLVGAWAAPSLDAADSIRVLIVDGQNNHDWERTTPYLQRILRDTGRFSVYVATTPPAPGSAEQWSGFRPRFSDYDVVLSNYNGETWPAHARTSFERFVRDGGGVVNVHAANNGFDDWPAFNEMIGLGWRPATFGARVTLDEDGREVRTPAGEGPGAGATPPHPFAVRTRDPQHPAMQGLPAEWMHPSDELYHGQRGPAEGMHVLATAWSDSALGGTSAHEPIAWWVSYGTGRVLTTMLGHVAREQPPETWSLRCRGFQSIVTRGCEWAATGEVTLPPTEGAPTAEESSLAPPF